MKSIVYTLSLICACGFVQAQDLAFTQYFSNKLYLNPAYSGLDYGTTVALSNQLQWNGGAGGDPFYYRGRSLAVSNEAGLTGFGLLLLDQALGVAPLRKRKLGGSFAFRNRFCDDAGDKNFYNIGFRISHNWLELNWQDLIFSSQIDPIRGPNSNLPPNLNADFLLQNSYMDLDVGFIYEAHDQETNFWRVGFSANNLVRTNNSLGLSNDTTGVRWVLHGTMQLGGSYKNNSANRFIGNIKLESQASYGTSGALRYNRVDAGLFYQWEKNSSQFSFGTMGHIADFTNKDGSLLGSRVRTNPLEPITGQDIARLGNAMSGLSGHAAFEFPWAEKSSNATRIAISYRHDLAGLRSDSRGIFEVSLTLKFRNADLGNCRRDRGKGGILNCHDF